MTKEWHQPFELKALELLDEASSAAVPPDRVIPSRWILTDKYAGLDPELVKRDQLKQGVSPDAICYSKPKARWVAGGHRDPDIGDDKASPRTDAPTADLLGQHLVMFLAASHRWPLLSSDVSNAFLRGQPVDRNLYIRLPKPLPPALLGKVNPNQLCRLRKGMYGLTEAPRLWFIEYQQKLLAIGFKRCYLLPAVFTFFQNGQLVAAIALHVDDGIMTGCPKLAAPIFAKMKETFEYGTWDEDNFRFTGRQITRGPDFSVIISMHEYINELEEIDIPLARKNGNRNLAVTERERSVLRGKLGELGWLARMSQPTLCFGVSRLQQRQVEATVQDLVDANILVRKAKQEALTVTIPSIPMQDLVIVAVSDASHATMRGLGSQAGWLTILADGAIRKQEAPATVVGWSSHKLRRVVRSTIAAETMGLSTAVEHAEFTRAALLELTDPSFTLKHWQEHVHKISVLWIIDAKSSYDHLTKDSGLPDDKRLAIDVAALRQQREQTGSEIYWLPGPQMPCDVLTKFDRANDAILQLLAGTWSLKEQPDVKAKRDKESSKRRERKAAAKEVKHVSFVFTDE